MELMVISDPVYFKGEARLISQLFEAGMPVLHLRKEDTGRKQYSKLIDEIDEIYHNRIALHQFHELIPDYPSIKRIHYPEWLRKETAGKDLPVNADERILSTSVHHLNSLQHLQGFKYAFYGPVFNSLSKSGYQGMVKQGFVLPAETAHLKIAGTGSLKVIALGGIDASKTEKVKDMGFDGLAVLGAIWNNRDQAIRNFKIIRDKC